MEEWKEIEQLVMTYQMQFQDKKYKEKSEEAAKELLERFVPFIRKYTQLLKTGKINFKDTEMKQFVYSFIDNPKLKKALNREKQRAYYKALIYQKFNFVKEVYGILPVQEIETDLQLIFLKIAKRYKSVGRNFCGYLYNVYKFEVSRFIKKYISNPANIEYKKMCYIDNLKTEYNSNTVEHTIEDLEDRIYENSFGNPDMTWISGQNCSEIFSNLTPFERKLIVLYYLENWNDKQIAEQFNIHSNTINQKRRIATKKIAKNLNLNSKDIKRNRRSGKDAITTENYYSKLF